MICVENVSKAYKDVKALNNFSCCFSHGIYAILGPNGSGKSTLMNILTGNLSWDRGTVTCTEEGGKSGPLKDIRIGYVPQYPGMYPSFTVYEMMDYTAALKKSENRSRQIEELLAAFELTEYSGKRIRGLSGGTKQRLAIALAFLGEPELVILDEPTAGLDPLQRILFKNFIAKMGKNMTVIISTHIVSDVESIADHVIFLKKGCVQRAGTLNEVLADLDGKCWSIHGADAVKAGTSRTKGDEVRVISSEKPCVDAVAVDPELEDCYLHVFGEEQ